MISISATVESIEQAQALLDSGIDTLYFGEEHFGLRLPQSFSREEQQQLTELAHQQGAKVTIAVNGIMHPEKMKEVPAYLDFLASIHVDQIMVGDPGIIYLLRKGEYDLPFIYDGETLVTNSRQMNFWHQKGALGSVLAREVPFGEMIKISEKLAGFAEVQVYGATCIHQSKRPLLTNYYHFTKNEERADKERGLFLAEPQDPDTHYSIFEDEHGTHIFATNDLNLMAQLAELSTYGYTHWKLDGLFTKGANFVEIARRFVAAKELLESQQWSQMAADKLTAEVAKYHPQERELDTGFYAIDPEAIK